MLLEEPIWELKLQLNALDFIAMLLYLNRQLDSLNMDNICNQINSTVVLFVVILRVECI